MISAPAEGDAEDVNDFLRRIQELGQRRDEEDEERNRKLEEEILQGRRERQARRAERARSISPSKGSPMNTPPPVRSTTARFMDSTILSPLSLKPSPSLVSSSRSIKSESAQSDNVTTSTGTPSTPKENIPKPINENVSSNTDLTSKKLHMLTTSPSSAMPSRNGTLSWQQRRPLSQASTTSMTRPLVMQTTENAMVSPKSSKDSSSSTKGDSDLSRDQIVQSLASKDPAWFRQTADGSRGTAAFRKNQVEDVDVVAHGQLSHLTRMPGMSNILEAEKTSNIDQGRSSPSLESNASHRTTFTKPTDSPKPLGIPPPILSPKSTVLNEHERPDYAGDTITSPSQTRISRPSSPTKGLGGFVQSAMMKRSDSVNKRWSVPSPTGLNRADSVVNTKNTLESAPFRPGIGSPTARVNRGSTLSRDTSPRPRSRPDSVQNVSIIAQDMDRPNTSESSTSELTRFSTDGATDLAPPESAAHAHRPEASERATDSMRARSRSPTKWSPTKSSWLESALSRPESPKPKSAQSPVQPSWMSEINKAKIRNANESSSPKNSAHLHTLSHEGPARFSTVRGDQVSNSKTPPRFHVDAINGDIVPANGTSAAAKEIEHKPAFVNRKISNGPPVPSSPKPLLPLSSTNAQVKRQETKPETPPKKEFRGNVKPETPPKKDFRANLKSRQPSPDTRIIEQPEFKSLRGQLRGAKTQNYVAPDTLRDNILRGKADLNLTEGPKKSERKDEFKEAITEKKEVFKKLQSEGKGVVRSPSVSSQDSPVPEALVRAKSVRKSDIDDTLNRSRSASRSSRAESPIPEALAKAALVRKSSTATRPAAMSGLDKKGVVPGKIESKPLRAVSHAAPSLRQETSSPARLQSSKSTTGLAAKFNPALANLLARGPPASSGSDEVSNAAQRQSSTPQKDKQEGEGGPQLTHMTKARARGPKRKAPSTKAETKVADKETSSIVDKLQSSEPVKETLHHAVKSDADQKATEAKPTSKITPTKPTKPLSITTDTTSSPTPKKLDMKRRSQFLADSPITSSPKLESPRLRSTSPVKEASFAFEKMSSGDTPTKLYKPAPLLMSPRTPKSPFLQSASPTTGASPRLGPGAPPKPRNLSGTVRGNTT